MARDVAILLRENLKDLGRCGEIVKVSPGYARNYLLPRKLAVPATPENQRLMARRRTQLDAAESQRTAESNLRVAALTSVTLTTSARADEHGHLYGSVNAAAIAELLSAAGQAVEEQDVRLEAPIKTLGAHPLRVHVHGDLHAELQIVVERAAD